MRDRAQQRGMTTLGFIIMIAFVGLFIYAGIRLLPVYLEYFNVMRSVQALKAEVDGGPGAMRKALQKHFDIEGITSVDFKDIEITKAGSGYDAHILYDAQAPFVGNVGFVVHFDNTVSLAAVGP